MATFNEEYRDAALRHQIDLRRYTAGLTQAQAGAMVGVTDRARRLRL